MVMQAVTDDKIPNVFVIGNIFKVSWEKSLLINIGKSLCSMYSQSSIKIAPINGIMSANSSVLHKTRRTVSIN
ncbi:hypothetical protein SOASR030_31080 [Leminorella grimontii]|uniref:Uncharacterized protein n=1 Tax=Leminorella grimontii TaxID=82981 RepID=A0AAV5N4F6_9GAMM|nr:hypothetical protein SOASR030_31080 [Leminorella grimontii]